MVIHFNHSCRSEPAKGIEAGSGTIIGWKIAGMKPSIRPANSLRYPEILLPHRARTSKSCFAHQLELTKYIGWRYSGGS